MKNVYKYLLVFFVGLLAAPAITYADCSYERQAELSRIAANVQFSYSYRMENDYPAFTVEIANITNDIYIEDGYLNKYYKDGSFKFETGQTLNFDIYSNDSSCKNEKMLTKYVTLPSFNSFSRNEKCADYPDFKYCSIWSSTGDITNDTFNSEIDKYIKSNNSVTSNVDENSLWNSLMQFINTNKIIILLTLGALVLLVIIIVVKKRWRR